MKRSEKIIATLATICLGLAGWFISDQHRTTSICFLAAFLLLVAIDLGLYLQRYKTKQRRALKGQPSNSIRCPPRIDAQPLKTDSPRTATRQISLVDPKLAGRSLAFQSFTTGEFCGIRWEWHYNDSANDIREPRGLNPLCLECPAEFERQPGAPSSVGARFWTRLRAPCGHGRLYYDIEGDYGDDGEYAEIKRLIRREIKIRFPI